METIKIKATNISLTDAIEEYVNAKLGRAVLEKFSGRSEIMGINVEIGKTTHHHHHGEVFRAEINVLIGGETVRAVSEKEDLYFAIDDVHDEIVNLLKNTKNKKDTLWKRGARSIKKILRFG